MPWACYLYPTTDQHLNSILAHQEEDFKSERAIREGRWVFFFKHSKKLKKMASFILNNRQRMKFRIQNKDTIFYCDENMARDLVCGFWNDWINADAVPIDRQHLLNQNTVLCKRLPHGKFEYQIHLKKNIHKILKQNQRENLYRYLSQNPDTCRISNRTLEEYLNGLNPYAWEGYFYVRDEKMLTPLYMIAPEIIQKVMRFIKVTK